MINVGVNLLIKNFEKLVWKGKNKSYMVKMSLTYNTAEPLMGVNHITKLWAGYC